MTTKKKQIQKNGNDKDKKKRKKRRNKQNNNRKKGVKMAAIISGDDYRWPHNHVPYVIDRTRPRREEVKSYIDNFNREAGMEVFTPRRAESYYVKVGLGGDCEIGCRRKADQELNVRLPGEAASASAVESGNVFHEMGHAAGFGHTVYETGISINQSFDRSDSEIYDHMRGKYTTISDSSNAESMMKYPYPTYNAPRIQRIFLLTEGRHILLHALRGQIVALRSIITRSGFGMYTCPGAAADHCTCIPVPLRGKPGFRQLQAAGRGRSASAEAVMSRTRTKYGASAMEVMTQSTATGTEWFEINTCEELIANGDATDMTQILDDIGYAIPYWTSSHSDHNMRMSQHDKDALGALYRSTPAVVVTGASTSATASPSSAATAGSAPPTS